MFAKLRNLISVLIVFMAHHIAFAHGGHGVPESVPHFHAESYFVLGLILVVAFFLYKKVQKQS